MTSAVAHRPEIVGFGISVPGKSRTEGVAKVRKLSSKELPLGSWPNAIDASEHGFRGRPISIRGAGGAPMVAPETHRTAEVDALLARIGPRTNSLRLRVGMKETTGVVGALPDFVKGGDQE